MTLYPPLAGMTIEPFYVPAYTTVILTTLFRCFAWFLMLALVGCGSMNTARPLESGQHALGLTLGGPWLTTPGSSSRRRIWWLRGVAV